MATANGVKKVSVDSTSSGVSPDFQSQVTTALLHNGGVARIQATLQQRLDEAGWSENLRKYVVQLYRSGEAVTYDDAWNKVMLQIKGSSAATNGAVNGGEGAPDLRIPQDAKTGGADVVRKELEQICEMKK